METRSPSRVELIIVGIGGMGVLVAGRLLATAGLRAYEHASWMPTYAESRRGGLSECTVILSNDPIASPILDQSQSIMLLDSSQMKSFEYRVRPGGTIVAEKASLFDDLSRDDIRLMPISGLEIAMGIGGVVANNLILLGAYMELVMPLPIQLITDELEEQYRGKDAVLKRNLDAFRKGMELGAALKV